MNKTIIGVDLGGTNIRAGRVKETSIKQTAKASVPATENWETVYEELRKTIKGVWSTDVSGIGIGVPGVVDYKTGMVLTFKTFPRGKKYHLPDSYQKNSMSLSM
jgi:glucokinase